MSQEESSRIKVRYKTCLVGSGSVGKTSIKRAYFGMEFLDNYAMTLGAEISVKKFNKYAMQIWDLGGQQGFKQILDDYFRDANSAILVYDIGRRDTFEAIPKWVEFLNNKTLRSIPMVLVGNKIDLRGNVPDEVTQAEGMALSQQLTQQSIYEIPYIEVSAKANINIEYVFAYVLSIMESFTEYDRSKYFQ